MDKNQYEFQILEFIWTVLPIIIIFYLGIPSLKILYKIDITRVENPGVSLKVVGHQWYWSYDYSEFKNLNFDSYIIPIDSIAKGSFRLLEVDNRVILPINTVVRYIITSADVLHSWAIPRLGIKVDANPGRLNSIFRTTFFFSTLYGQCSEICGANHRFMPIVLEFCSLGIFKGFISRVYFLDMIL